MSFYSLLVKLFLVASLCRAILIRLPDGYRNPRGDVCVEVVDHPCNEVFHKTAATRYAKFPNSRGLMLEGTKKELEYYTSMFPEEQPRGCYREMWSLLCFHYFPQCRPNLPVKYIVTPCRELCERAQTGCESFMRSKNFTWPEHLRCTNFNSSTTDHMCINSPAPSQSMPSLTAPSPTSTSVVLITPTSTLNSSQTPSPSPGLCNTCRVQREANNNTFTRNNYTFAANVTIIDANRDPSGSHLFLAIVTRLWILDSQNCSRYENPRRMIIRTTPNACQPPCPNFNTTTGHNVYLVSGYCNNRGWYLPTTDSLVSPWFKYPEYETNLDTWIRGE